MGLMHRLAKASTYIRSTSYFPEYLKLSKLNDDGGDVYADGGVGKGNSMGNRAHNNRDKTTTHKNMSSWDRNNGVYHNIHPINAIPLIQSPGRHNHGFPLSLFCFPLLSRRL